MKKPETKFKEKVQRDLETIKDGVWSFKSQEVAVHGIPDIIMCVRGRFVALELKAEASLAPDPLQDYVLRRIAKTARGYAWHVHPDNWPEIFYRIKLIAAGVINQCESCSQYYNQPFSLDR